MKLAYNEELYMNELIYLLFLIAYQIYIENLGFLRFFFKCIKFENNNKKRNNMHLYQGIYELITGSIKAACVFLRKPHLSPK